LISITFCTDCDAMYGPWVERESTEISTPPLNMKPSVVVPFENFKVCAWSSYRGAKCWWQNDAGCEVVGGCVRFGGGVT
jgi:hypothetical protein